MHLEVEKLAALAERALGLVDDPRLGFPPVEPPSPEESLHLASCAECQENLAAVSATISGTSRWEPESLDGWRVVDFVPTEVHEALRVEMEPRAAADDVGLAALGPGAENEMAFRSADDAVEITVAADWDDDCCYLYPYNVAGIDETRVRFFLPPGLVLPWPASGAFRFPLYTYRHEDWSQVKLLYPREPQS